MAKRKKLGLLFTYDPAWIGGSYYILNLIHALNAIDDASKPEIIVLSYNEHDFEIVKKTGYPFLEYRNLFIKQNSILRLVNKFYRLLIGKNLIVTGFKSNDFDAVFPFKEIETLKFVRQKMYWIPDFQQNYYPSFFSQSERDARKNEIVKISVDNAPVIFSSKAALTDFRKFFPEATCKTFVINFAVSNRLPEKDIASIRQKYGVKEKYFISPNQFWSHKNHVVLIEAIKILNEKGNHLVQVVFTGKEDDYRNPNYSTELKTLVNKYGLNSQILFLGFIDREEQLCLVKNAVAVVQPSLFEGWSTVIEDAKSMGRFVVASDIAVHREQIIQNCAFFDPANPHDLARIIEQYYEHEPEIIPEPYEKNIIRFGIEFNNLLSIQS